MYFETNKKSVARIVRECNVQGYDTIVTRERRYDRARRRYVWGYVIHCRYDGR